MQWEKLTFSTASSAQQHLFVSVMKVDENAAFDCYYYYNDNNNNSTRRSCSVGVPVAAETASGYFKSFFVLLRCSIYLQMKTGNINTQTNNVD